MNKKCLCCKKNFKTYSKGRKFCSQSCSSTYNNKITWKDKEIRMKRINAMSKSLTGKPSPFKGKNLLEICGEIRYLEVKGHFKKSEKTKQKMSYHAKNFPSEKQLKHREKFSSGIYQKGKIPWNKGKPFLQGKENPHFGCPNEYYKGHGRKKRKDLNNQFFRSKWEANFARVLNYWKIPWEYEKTRFDLGDCTYCPDFKIYDVEPYFVEVIGFFDDIHKNKLSLLQKMHPNEKIQIISSAEYKDLKDKFSTIIENWEK